MEREKKERIENSRLKGREGEQRIPNGERWRLSIHSAAQAVSFGHSIIQSFG